MDKPAKVYLYIRIVYNKYHFPSNAVTAKSTQTDTIKELVDVFVKVLLPGWSDSKGVYKIVSEVDENTRICDVKSTFLNVDVHIG